MKIELPHNGWKPRPYQQHLWNYLNNGGTRAVACWMRRAGKDDVALHWAAVSMIRRAASYWHMLPMKDQARTAIWSAVNPHTGIRRIDEAFPDALFDKRETDMMIKCKANASTWQIKGSDNYSAGIGSPPAGIVFSEYAMADPNAWAYLRPILRENGGWAIFISTPRGHNHFENMLNYARNDDGWFGEVLTNDDTHILSPTDIATELRELAAERGSLQEAQALIDQEYFCSFSAALPGAIYGAIIEDMEKSTPPRIARIPHDPNFAVDVSSDLGASEGNDMALVFSQRVGTETRIIDCDSEVGVGIDWVVDKLNQRARDKRYVYQQHGINLPHDAAHPQSSNEGAMSFAQKLSKNYGYKNRVNPPTKSLGWSLDLCKKFMRTCVIDTGNCQTLLSALRNYHRKWDAQKRCYSEHPVHDWSSNLCDAYRTLVESKAANITTQGRAPGSPIACDPFSRNNRRGNTALIDEDPLHR